MNELEGIYALCQCLDASLDTSEKTFLGIADVLLDFLSSYGDACVRITAAGQKVAVGHTAPEASVHRNDILVFGKLAGVIETSYSAPSTEAQHEATDRLFAFAAKRMGKLLERIQREQSFLDNQQHLARAAKMESLATLVSGLAHEINNPNHIALLGVQNLMNAWPVFEPILDQYQQTTGNFRVGGVRYSDLRKEIPGIFSGIVNSLQRIESVVHELRNFVRSQPLPRMDAVDISLVVKASVVLMTGMLRKSTQGFSAEFGENLPKIRGDFQQLEQVVINLILNACESLPDIGCAIRVACFYDEAAETVVIEVRDEGQGILPEHIDRVMDPFFTTRRASGATGLGLWVASGIIEDHSGAINIASTPGAGTIVRVMLPIVPKPSFMEEDRP